MTRPSVSLTSLTVLYNDLRLPAVLLSMTLVYTQPFSVVFSVIYVEVTALLTPF